MKSLILLILAIGFYSASAQVAFNTGNAQMDADLNVINTRGSSDFVSFRADMRVSYNVSESKIDYMKGTLHMVPGEIYLALEISSIARISLDNVLSIYKTDKNKGWGYIAKQAGIKPGSEEFHQLKNNVGAKQVKGPDKKEPQGKGNNKKK